VTKDRYFCDITEENEKMMDGDGGQIALLNRRGRVGETGKRRNKK